MPVLGLPILRSAVLVGAVGFLIFMVNSGNWVDQQLTSRHDQTALEESLSVFINHQMNDKNIPGLSISVIQEQDWVFEQGFGFADPNQTLPASPYTVYHGGTLAQLFTTIAVLQRVELGYLNLDEPVSTYLPDFYPQNPYGLPLTLRQILSHQSGLPTEPLKGHSYDPLPASLEESVYSLNQATVVYPPETFTKFSNAGFGVAGLIIEKSLDRPFAQYMRAILDRMDLMRTSYSPRLDLMSKLAQGYAKGIEQVHLPTTELESTNAPASNLYTTAHDLGTFLKVIFAEGLSPNGSIVSPRLLEQMWTVQLSTVRKQVPYGLGLAVSETMGHTQATLSSSHNGYSAYIGFIPEYKIGVAILANVEKAESTLDQIGTYALEFMIHEQEDLTPPPVPRTYPVDSTLFTQALGYYESPDPLYISALKEDLYLYHSGGRYKLKQQGDTLIVDDAHAYGTILLSDGLSIQLDNTLYVKKDLFSTPQPNNAYNDIYGAYGQKERAFLLTEQQGDLYAIKDWATPYKLDPISQDTFALPADGLYGGEEVYIIRDEEQQVSGLFFANMYLEKLATDDVHNRVETLPLKEPFSPLAKSSSPVPQVSATAESQLVDLTMIDPLLNMDVKLTSGNNIFGTKLYNDARILLQQPIASAIFNIKRKIRSDNLGLVIHDAYRPWRTTDAIWNSVPDSLKQFFSSPETGSCQNRGAAISVSLFTLNTGEPLPMPTPYGVISSGAYADFPLLPAEVRRNRDLLRHHMESEGFKASKYRWWHFEHLSCSNYPIIDILHENVNQNNAMDREPITIVR